MPPPFVPPLLEVQVQKAKVALQNAPLFQPLLALDQR